MTIPFRGTPAGAQTLDDTARLREIADLRLHDSDVDDIFSEVTAEAAAHFGLPVALVSIVLDQAQDFVGSHGLDGWMATTRRHARRVVLLPTRRPQPCTVCGGRRAKAPGDARQPAGPHGGNPLPCRRPPSYVPWAGDRFVLRPGT